MSPIKRYAKKQAKARARRRHRAQERLERDQRQAQRAAEGRQQALEELGLPETIVAEIAGRLRSQQKLLGKIFGGMFPALFGCRTPSELCRVRGWDKNWPSRRLRALPKRSWLKRLRRVGLEVWEPLWRPGAPCRDKLSWARVLLDARLAALRRRGLVLPPPMVVADSWWSDAKLMPHVHKAHQGTVLVEGKQSYVFPLADGQQVKGAALIHGEGWLWRQHPWEPRVRYVRLRAPSPTYGKVTSVSHLLHMAFCGAMRFTIPTVIRAPCDGESTPPAEAA